MNKIKYKSELFTKIDIKVKKYYVIFMLAGFISVIGGLLFGKLIDAVLKREIVQHVCIAMSAFLFALGMFILFIGILSKLMLSIYKVKGGVLKIRYGISAFLAYGLGALLAISVSCSAIYLGIGYVMKNLFGG